MPNVESPGRAAGLGAVGVACVAIEFVAGTPGRTLGWFGAGGAVLAVAALARSHLRLTRARATDVEHHQAEVERLEGQLSLHTALLSSLSIGIVAYDGGRAIFSNPQAQSELGARLESAAGLIPVAVRAIVEEASAGGGVHTTRFETDYPARTIEARAHSLAPEEVVVLRLVDVSDSRRTEAVRRDFVSAASHELKTPVAAIQAAAETVLTIIDEDAGAAKNFSQRIYDNATRLARIVSDLLDLSRLESVDPTMQALDLATIVADEVRQMSSVAPDLHLGVESVLVVGNAADIALAVRNLLDNAVRYSGQGGTVSVSVGETDAGAVIEVTDDGPGIPAGALPRIFERFYRVDAARSRATGGTGLGLAIVKHVAEEHGGRVEAESVLGQGSTFRIIIPIRDPHETEVARPVNTS